jgi:serine/threonine-protein kinase RsbW
MTVTAPARPVQTIRGPGYFAAILPGDEPDVAGIARDLVRKAISPGPVADAAASCVSELVSNAAIHSRSGRRPGGQITVAVHCKPGRRVTIEVTDDGPPGPPAPYAIPADEHGRGLKIVDSLSEEWGVKPVNCGRCTWCLLTPESVSVR